MILLMFSSLLTIWVMVGNSEREPNWRFALIQALIIWAAYLILGTELLGAFKAITKPALSVMWFLPILAVGAWIWLRLRKHKVLRLPIVYHRDSWVGTILDLFLVLILVVTAVVAVSSPPNSSNGMIYRMSRVAHWAQNQSLEHYATGIEPQNSNAPGAEIMQLNFYVLAGNDRTVNLVAWVAFAGMIAAAASLAEVFGAQFNAQRLAAIFAATIPVAITQATSSMNDVVVAFWVVSTVLMLLSYTRQSAKPLNLVLAALAAALAIVTKTDALLFLWPFALYIIVVLLQRQGLGKLLLWAMVALAAMGLINGGNFYRNQVAYGQFYRPAELANQTNEIRNWQVMFSNIARNGALHADLPFPRAENWFQDSIVDLHEALGMAVDDPRTTLGGPFYIPEVNTSERTSGNPLHAAILLFSFVILVAMVLLGKEDPGILIYTSAIFFSLILFCYLLKWQPTNGMLHLPFFVLFAPLVALTLDRLAKIQGETVVALILLVYAVPWLLQTQERPLLPNLDRTYPVSVLTEEREKLYFTTNPEDYPAYRAITATIKAQGFTRIGLDLTPESEEYPFWALLGAPDEGLWIEWVATDTASELLLDTDFTPQAIICERCSEEDIAQYSERYEKRIEQEPFDLFLTPAP